MHQARPAVLRRLPLLLLLSAIVAALLLVPTRARADDGSTPSGSGNVKDRTGNLVFGMGPANHVPAKQIVDGRAYLVYSADPGATVLDRVAIFNYEATPLTVQVYATDAVQGSDGGFGLLTGDQTPSDAGSWIRLLGVPKNGKVTIPGRAGTKPYGVRYVRFLAQIPLSVTPGDHVGGVVASLKSTSTNKQGAKVTLDQRIGLRAYFSLAGKAAAKVSVEDLTGHYDDQRDPRGLGRYTVRYVVHNAGNLRVDVGQDVRIGRCVVLFVCPVGALTAQPETLRDVLPGSRIVVTQTFPRAFGLGRPEVTVALHPRAVDRGFTGTKIADSTASARFWAWPWLFLLIVVLVLVALGGGGWRREKRRRARARARAEAAAAPAPRHAAPAHAPEAVVRRGRVAGVLGTVRNLTVNRTSRTEG